MFLCRTRCRCPLPTWRVRIEARTRLARQKPARRGILTHINDSLPTPGWPTFAVTTYDCAHFCPSLAAPHPLPGTPARLSNVENLTLSALDIAAWNVGTPWGGTEVQCQLETVCCTSTYPAWENRLIMEQVTIDSTTLRRIYGVKTHDTWFSSL